MTYLIWEGKKKRLIKENDNGASQIVIKNKQIDD